MQHLIQRSAALATLLSLCAPASAQSLYFDGLLNSPLGSASLSENANGQLVVSNIGSSGQDGVSIDLGDSHGGSVTAGATLSQGDVCVITGNFAQQGSRNTLPISLTMTGDENGTDTLYLPDFSSIGQATYTLRAYHQGQLVFEGDDQDGPCRMSNVQIEIPEKVYLFLPDWVGGPNYPSFCGFVDGNITPPSGQGSFPCDFVEFIGDVGPITGMVSMEVTADGPPNIFIDDEEQRFFEHFVSGMDDAHVSAQGDLLVVDNLGSSGCDGVSIAGGPGNDGLSIGAQSVAAAGNPGSIVWMEAQDAALHTDGVRAEEIAGEWLFTPDFTQQGTALYTLELYDAGQLVFQQSGMTGSAVSMASFDFFERRSASAGGNALESEWTVGSANAGPVRVFNGPVVQADTLTLRSEGSGLTDSAIKCGVLRASNTSTPFVLTSISDVSTGDCLGSNYCIAATNSTGVGAAICASGSSSIADNALVLTCTGLPTNQFGLFYYGPNQISAPFGNGYRCVGGSVYRLPILNSGATGSMTHAVDNTNPPSAGGQLLAGSLWNFQCWYRDPAAGGAAFNLSDATEILFLP